MTEFYYQLYGLRLRSAIALPELASGEHGEVDVDIRLVEHPPAIGTPIAIDEVADFVVEAGRTIFVTPAPAAQAANVRLFLLGSAMGLLIHQRGDLPLHANCMLVGEGAAIFLGASGSGKSTLAAWMTQNGLPALSDDVCVVRSTGAGTIRLFPGVARLRLWEDALRRGGMDSDRLSPVYEGDPAYRKYNVPIEPFPDAAAGWPVGAAYVLDWGERFAIEQIVGAEAVSAYFAHTYRGEYVHAAGHPARHWEQCVGLAAAVPTFRIVRPMDAAAIDVENHRIRAHLVETVKAAGQA